MKKCRLLTLGVLFASASECFGSVLIGNYPPTNDLTQSADLTNLRQKALSFVTPPAPTVLASVKVRLNVSNLAQTPIVQIRTGVSPSSVGTVVHTLTPPAPFVSGVRDYTFTSSGFLLFGTSTYWLVVLGTNGTFGTSWLASSPSVPTAGTATFGMGLFSTNGNTFNPSSSINTHEIRMQTLGNQTISGPFTLLDTVSPFSASRSIQYRLKQGTNTLLSGVVLTNLPSSTYSFTLPVTVTGPVRLELDGSSFLKRALDFSLTGADQTLGSIVLPNGDVDTSGEVDAADIDAVIAAFGSTVATNPDVDASGEVDAADIDVVISNFGVTDE